MTLYELWVKGCQEFKDIIFTLEEWGDIRLLMTFKQGRGGIRKDVCYHIWQLDGKQKHIVSFNYRGAYNVYKNILEDYKNGRLN